MATAAARNYVREAGKVLMDNSQDKLVRKLQQHGDQFTKQTSEAVSEAVREGGREQHRM
jgi:hypothetical protein